MRFFMWDMRNKVKIQAFIVGLIMSYGSIFIAQQQLQQRTSDPIVTELLERSEFNHAAISIHVQGIYSPDVILDYNGSMSLIPASIQKILTTYSALDILGPEYTYQTQITHDGSIQEDGTLDGNVYIEGVGDPTLGSGKVDGGPTFYQTLSTIVSAAQNVGIESIAGDIIADESLFDSYPISPSWQWNDLGNYYASGAWGINIHDNQYFVSFKQTPEEGGYPALLRYSPHIPALELENEITTGKKGSGDEAYIFGGPYDYKKRIVGTIPPGTSEFMIKGSIPDPPLFMAYHLQRQFKKAKIESERYRSTWKKSKNKSRRKSILSIESVSMSDIVKLSNFQSNNLFCEAILKTMGLEKYKKGSGQYGIRAIQDFCKKNNISTTSFFLEDGSGLSFRNRISALGLSDFIKTVCNNMGLEEFTNYLPKMGMQGTVRSMLRGKPSRGYVWAKSGSMNGVISYAGVLKTKAGRWLSFVVIINGFEEKYKEVRPHLETFIHQLYLTK